MPSETPLFSICCPVYNAEKYLVSCLDSLVNQTFGDFELLLCDDKSTDGTLPILERYARKDSRIRLFRNSSNQGSLYTRNHLFAAARGEYSVWMDADDYLSLDCLEEAASCLQETPCDILEFPYEIHYPDGKNKHIQRQDIFVQSPSMAEIFFLNLRPYLWYMWSKFFRTEIMKKVIPPDDRVILDDVFYGMPLFYYATSYRWRNLGRPMYHYRFLTGGWSSLEKNFSLEQFQKICLARARQLTYNLRFAMAKHFGRSFFLQIADHADLRTLLNTMKPLTSPVREQALEIFFQYFGQNGQLVNGVKSPLSSTPLLRAMRAEKLI